MRLALGGQQLAAAAGWSRVPEEVPPHKPVLLVDPFQSRTRSVRGPLRNAFLAAATRPRWPPGVCDNMKLAKLFVLLLLTLLVGSSLTFSHANAATTSTGGAYGSS